MLRNSGRLLHRYATACDPVGVRLGVNGNRASLGCAVECVDAQHTCPANRKPRRGVNPKALEDERGWLRLAG